MPVFPPAGVINGRRTFDQITVPTNQSRGDFWRERDVLNDIAMEWAWNGTYWLSLQEFRIIGANAATTAASVGGSNSNIILNASPNRNLYIERFLFCGFVNGVHDSNNYWSASWRFRRKSDRAGFSLIEIRSDQYLSNFSTPTDSVEIRPAILVDKSIYYSGYSFLSKVGTPGSLDFYGLEMAVRYARP